MLLLWLFGAVCASSPAPVAPAAQGVVVVHLVFPAGTPVGDVRAALASHPEGVTLELQRAARSWNADEVEALLFRSPEVRNVRHLVLAGNEAVGAAGAMAIAASPHLEALVELDLRGCRIGEAGARGLAYSEGLGKLTRLAIDTKDPGPRGMEELEKRFGERLVAE